jgi:hypothetical protein
LPGVAFISLVLTGIDFFGGKRHMKKSPTVLLFGILLFIFTLMGCESDSNSDGLTFTFTFNNDTEGWIAGFADLPANADPVFYQLESSYRKLPSGLSGFGIYIQGDNHSDDLFMFLKTQVSGLPPNTVYLMSFSIELATNVPSGLVGIGGSPGEDVSVKTGATTIEPVVIPDDLNWLRMNIDKGNQAQGGQDMIVIGNVAHPDLEEDSTDVYTIKLLSSPGRRFEVATDNNGSVWFIVGTDSGFEGLTALYYSRITVSLNEVVRNAHRII